MAKYIEFASDDDIIKGAVGQVLNDKDLDMRFDVPQPIKGGIYDRKIFGNTGHCTCHLITQGVCPQCGEMVFNETDYKKNYAYYQLHVPFIIRLKLDSLIDKLNRLGIKLPKPKSIKGTVNRDNLASIWSLEFSVIAADVDDVEARIERLADKMGGERKPLDEYPIDGKNGKPYILQIFEIEEYSNINQIGPIGLKQLAWYKYEGKSLDFINDHINSVLPLMSPGLRNYSIREIGGKPTKDIPEISLEYKMIIYADKYIKNANETITYRNAIDQASMCYLLNCLYDQHIQNADMLQTSKQATFRKNVGTRVGASMRGNAISYLGATIGEIYLPKALAYHALQTQIIDKLCEDGRQGYDALKLYLKMDSRAIEAFHYIVDHSQVLMNRNPSLHRNNILQYTPRLWQDDTPAIGVNPYVCFTGDTKVRMTNGKMYTFEELTSLYKAGKTKSLKVFATDELGKRVPSAFTNVGIRDHVHDLVKLVFPSGYQIVCTPEHPFRTASGQWIEAKHITEDTELDCLDFEARKDKKPVETTIQIWEKINIHSEEPVPVYCLEVPDFHNFAIEDFQNSSIICMNCKSYNLDFDGDQVAVYFVTDPKELTELGTSLRAENVWFFDKNHDPAYELNTTIIYGLYAATNDQPEKPPLREFDTFNNLEKAYNKQEIEHDQIIIMLPNRKSTYAREKLAQIIGKPLDTFDIGLGKPISGKEANMIIAALSTHPDRLRIMNEFRDFGAEIATLVGIVNLPLEDIYRGFSDKVMEVAKDPVLSEEAKLSKINAMLPKEIEKQMAELPDNNTEILLKGSRIGKKTLEALYAPYVRLDENGKVKVGDSNVIEGLSEEEYVTLAHSQRRVLEIKSTAVPRAGYNRTQLVLVSLDLVYHKEINDDKSYVYFDEKQAKKDGYTFAKEAPHSKYAGLMPIYSTAVSPNTGIYMQQVSKITNQITADGTHLGITFADALAESFYQMELGLKYGGQLRQLTNENTPALTSGYAEVLPDGSGIKMGQWIYRLGDDIVPSEKVLKKQPIKEGDLIAINGNTVPIEKRFASFYTIFQLQVSGKTRSSDSYYNETGMSYAPFDGVIRYRNGKVYLDGKEIDTIRDKVTYFFPEGWKVKFGQRIAGLTFNLAEFLKFCPKEYAAYVFYKEMDRILPGCSVDLALIMYKVIVNADFSVKEKMRNQEDFITRQLYGATTKGLSDAIKKNTDENMHTKIKLNTQNPILKLLLRSGIGSSFNDGD